MRYFLGFILLFSLGMTINAYRFGYGFEDVFFRTLLFMCEGTTWSDNFSEEAFNKIQLGMTKEEVQLLLGDPIGKSSCKKSICFWLYTGHDTGTADFDQRWIVFGEDKRVQEVRKSFYID